MASMRTVPHSRPTIDQKDIDRVLMCLRSGQVSMGPGVQGFEAAFAAKFQLGGAAAVSSGTAALHLALLALGVGEGHEVIIPTYVCTALSNAVHYAGARPVLVDVGYEDGNMAPLAVRRKLSRKTRAIIVPHMFGEPADLAALRDLGVPLIEDCAQAVGARYAGKPVGTFGQVSVFSFYATKMMTTGEGGMVVSQDKKVLRRVRDLLSYDHKPECRVRFNYKMSDIQASFGLAQLQRLEKFVARRRSMARYYNERLKGVPCVLPANSVVTEPVYYRYVVKVRGCAAKVIAAMQKQGVQCERPVFRPLHVYHRIKGFPVADQLMKDSVSLPLYPGLTAREAEKVVHALRRVLT